MTDRFVMGQGEQSSVAKRLTMQSGQFFINQVPIQILSGAIHYFRVPHQYWKDRLLKLKACGLNTVETYIPWNFHEPSPGVFHFEGDRDIVHFIRLAEQVGLYVIIRPSPYICAEWDFGGLPAWLLADRNMCIRSADRAFLKSVDLYYNVLLKKLKPLQSTQQGPIIAMQIENEYGSYGNDAAYLSYLKQAMRDRGIDVMLFTSDGPRDLMLTGGTMPGELATVNFGSRPREAFGMLKKHQPQSAEMCMEFWNGWFDHWGDEHHTRSGEDVADVLDDMLSQGASVNFYMFHGGTNFGFTNGANHDGKTYQPTVTSYDYDAPLRETGDITEKFYHIRKTIAKYHQLDELELPEPIAKKAYGVVKLNQQVELFDILGHISMPFERTHPVSMENIGQNGGFILYRNRLKGMKGTYDLDIKDVHDRALIFLDGVYQTTIDRNTVEKVKLHVTSECAQLDILVENMGRINYGPLLGDRKGITESVRIDYQFLYNWAIFPLPLEDLSGIAFEDRKFGQQSTPSFYKGMFTADEACDTFLELPGWTKGVVFLNGRNLGRYWEIGPQRTLYVPGVYLQQGENELIVFELHANGSGEVVFHDKPILGGESR